MFETINLGHILIAVAIAIFGFFIRRELSRIDNRLNSHDDLILDLVKNVSELVGILKVK